VACLFCSATSNRLLNPQDILTICSSLVFISEPTAGDAYEKGEIKLAHFSVKEFLVSDRIRKGKACKYCIHKCPHGCIAQTCLAYLLYFGESTLLTKADVDVSHYVRKFPLAQYAAHYWFEHARTALKEHNSKMVSVLVMNLFSAEKGSYLNWVRLWDPYHKYCDMTRTFEIIAPPLHYASLIGLLESVRRLLASGADVNVEGEYFENALQAASYRGHHAIVLQLLKFGADVNTKGWKWGNALQAAATKGHDTITQVLLDSGADVHAQGGCLGNALQAATIGGHYAIVQQLIKFEADVNAKWGY
jgi:hypothetical protein